jgi:hypothetical protein
MTRTSRWALLALFAAACVGTHPPPQYAWDPKENFAPLKTYAWYDGPGFQPPHGDSIIDGQFIDRRIRTAVDRELGGKGFQKVEPASASMFVSYSSGDTGVADEIKDPNMDWLTGYADTMYEKERAVIIDIRDSGKKLIWRGSITRLEGQNPDAAGREIDHEVAVLLGKFPPAPGSVPSKN